MSSAQTNASQPGSPVVSWCLGNRHFLIAALILAIAAGGWSAAVHFLQWATQKEPVPWPADMEVDAETFRLLTLKTQFGPYRRVEKKDGIGKKSDPLDGENILEESIMEPLEIGTARDKRNVSRHKSNWYVSRIYLDTRKNWKADVGALWQLDVFQYTGGLDKVPHVPEICAQAGGATLKSTTRIEFDVPGAREGWRKTAVRRVLFEKMDRDGRIRQYVQYYTLSVNDEMVTDRLTVRRKLTYPWVRYCYFAKVQFAPLGPVPNVDEADRAAGEFMKHFLPEVLRTLTTAQDIERLNARSQ